MPSDAHIDLQHRAVVWLNNRATGRGVKAGFEITVAPGYVADVVALLSFQYRHAQRYGLIETARHHAALGPAEAVECAVTPACVFEAKASRADFLSTFGPSARSNRRFPVADLHWLVAAKGVAWPDELPAFWGMLVASGCGLREVKPPLWVCASDQCRLGLARELLWHGCEARPEKGLARGWWAERRRLRDALEFYAYPKDRPPEDAPGDRARAALVDPKQSRFPARNCVDTPPPAR